MPLKRETATQERPAHIQCSHETCDFSAIVKVLTLTGWAKFCEPHYVRYHQDLALENFTKVGLDRLEDETREEWRKRVFAHIRGKMKLKTFDDAQEAA